MRGYLSPLTLASILEDLAASTRKYDPEAFSKVATATDGCPGQLLRGIRAVCWLAYNFPEDVGDDRERMQDCLQMIGQLAETVSVLLDIDQRAQVDAMLGE